MVRRTRSGKSGVWDSFICCNDCSMWLDFKDSGVSCSFDEASHDSFKYVCPKCMRLKLLESRLCHDVGVQCSAVMVDSSCQSFGSVSVDTDSFTVLDSVGFDVEHEICVVDDGASPSIVDDASTESVDSITSKVVWIGDSLVRHVDREFCRQDRRNEDQSVFAWG